MKIIHVADIHLDSAFSSKEGGETSETRRIRLAQLFQKLVEYAKENGVKVILLSGDIFDTSDIRRDQRMNFLSIISKYSDIDFLYLRGNHDINVDFSDVSLVNLKTFNPDEWTKYKYENIVISGREMTDKNYEKIYDGLDLNKDDINIVMMHGEAKNNTGKDVVDLTKLVNKNIDYLALGHIHKRSEDKLDNRGVYVNPGCLQGRGFDETGEKGFYLLDINGNKINHKFIPFSEFEYIDESLDITDCNSDIDVTEKIKNEITKPKNRYRIRLTGRYNKSGFDWANAIERSVLGRAKYVKIIDETRLDFDIEKIQKENTFIGEFVRNVLADKELSKEEKNQIIDIGLSSLCEDKKGK